jgi:hypothetical protein
MTSNKLPVRGEPTIGQSENEHSHAATHIDSTAPKKETVESLPNEVWDNILKHVDDPYDLWVNCRRVSRSFETSAEGAFRRYFLPLFRLEYQERPHRFGRSLKIRAQLDDAISSGLSSSTAYFKLQTSCGPRYLYNDRPGDRGGNWKHLLNGEFDYGFKHLVKNKQILTDYLFRRSQVPRPSHPLVPTSFHLDNPGLMICYVNNPAIRGRKFHLHHNRGQEDREGWADEGHLELDWKATVSAFFAEEWYVRSRIDRSLRTTPTLAPHIDNFRSRLLRRCPSLCRVDGVSYISKKGDKKVYDKHKDLFIESVMNSQFPRNEKLYEVAYAKRIRWILYLQGEAPPMDAVSLRKHVHGQFEKHYKEHVRKFGQMKKAYLTKCAEAAWEREFGNVVETLPPKIREPSPPETNEPSLGTREPSAETRQPSPPKTRQSSPPKTGSEEAKAHESWLQKRKRMSLPLTLPLRTTKKAKLDNTIPGVDTRDSPPRDDGEDRV